MGVHLASAATLADMASRKLTDQVPRLVPYWAGKVGSRIASHALVQSSWDFVRGSRDVVAPGHDVDALLVRHTPGSTYSLPSGPR